MPRKPDYSMGYVWKLYPDYDIFLTDLQTKSLEQLTSPLVMMLKQRWLLMGERLSTHPWLVVIWIFGP